MSRILVESEEHCSIQGLWSARAGKPCKNPRNYPTRTLNPVVELSDFAPRFWHEKPGAHIARGEVIGSETPGEVVARCCSLEAQGLGLRGFSYSGPLWGLAKGLGFFLNSVVVSEGLYKIFFFFLGGVPLALSQVLQLMV